MNPRGKKWFPIPPLGLVLDIIITTIGILLVMQAAYGLGLKSEFDRIMALIVGVWLLSMAVIDKRLKSMDESLTMIGMASATKDILKTINAANKKMREIQENGTKTGNGAKAAQEADHFDTTAKTGAHE